MSIRRTNAIVGAHEAAARDVNRTLASQRRSRVPGECSEATAERNESRDPAQELRSAALFPPAIRRVAPGSRVSLRSPGTREWGRAHDTCEIAAREANRWPSSQFTMSNSAVFFVPATRCCARVFCPFARLARGFGVEAAVTCGNPGSSNPMPPNEGWAERRQAHYSLVARARRDHLPRCDAGRCLSALHRGDFRPGAALPSPALPPDPCSELCPPPGARPGGTGSRASRGAVRAAAAGRHSSLRLQDRLRTTPLMSEDGESCTINPLRSQ